VNLHWWDIFGGKNLISVDSLLTESELCIIVHTIQMVHDAQPNLIDNGRDGSAFWPLCIGQGGRQVTRPSGD
jgi:hypothetical protein